MAIWQYNVSLIPLINFDKNYLEFIKQEDSDYLKSTECFWNETFVNKNEIELKIDEFITDQKSISNNFLYWKGDTSNFYDNDCSIGFDENDNINFFNFRFDLRNEINIIQSIDLLIEIAQEYHLKFTNVKYVFF
ncbi:hypothetical protein [Empedobacter tilapiae]|uniref:Uncharacterized protein n=2 Tax=Empedobacter tilapiae TaxID=2491114 RepID=A0A4Z1BNT3_9FLAO|nr:hypothetical protein [Empedobacter tilapiae]TGN29197.1 hypothetical protein E4J94_04375 [Empedobacter tilapiae]